LDAAKKSEQGLKTEIDRATVSLKSAEKAYGANSAVANSAREKLDELTEQHSTAAAEVKKLEGQIASQNKTLQSNADAVTKAETALNKAKATESALKSELDKTNAAIKSHKAQWEAAAKSLDKFGERSTAAGQNLSKVGQSLSTYVTAPLLAMSTASVIAYGKLDTAARKVSTVADTTVLSLEGIKSGVRDLSDRRGRD
jgi:chromosome segregation ATPase